MTTTPRTRSSTSSMPCSRKLQPLPRMQPSLPTCFRCRMMGDTPSLDLAPEERRQRTQEALTEQLAGLTRQRPALMIVEDAHWVDPTSLEVFGRTVDQIKTLPVLLIVTFRPEFNAPSGWTVACDELGAQPAWGRRSGHHHRGTIILCDNAEPQLSTGYLQECRDPHPDAVSRCFIAGSSSAVSARKMPSAPQLDAGRS